MNEGTYNIPDRMWFRIDEVCSITGVREYILKFWQKEFISLRPLEDNHHKGLLSKNDIYTVIKIKNLLFDKRLTIDEAKLELSGMGVDSIEPEHSGDSIENEIDEVPPPPAESNVNELDKEQVLILSKQLSKILAITDNLKSIHNWN